MDTLNLGRKQRQSTASCRGHGRGSVTLPSSGTSSPIGGDQHARWFDDQYRAGGIVFLSGGLSGDGNVSGSQGVNGSAYAEMRHVASTPSTSTFDGGTGISLGPSPQASSMSSAAFTTPCI